MRTRLLGLATVFVLGMFVSSEATRVPAGPAPEQTSVPARLAQVALGGALIVLSPIGSMVGCGGNAPTPTSATAVALAEAVVEAGPASPVVIAGGTAAIVSPIGISDRRPVSQAVVSVRLSPTEMGHVRVALRHPSGVEVLLYEGDSVGFATAFDTSSRPELHALLAGSPEGVWSLLVSSSRDASLESWSLRLRVRE